MRCLVDLMLRFLFEEIRLGTGITVMKYVESRVE